MVADETSRPSIQLPSLSERGLPNRAETYSLFGLQVQSDFILPVPGTKGGEGEHPDWLLRRCEIRHIPKPDGPIVGRLGRAGNESVLRYHGPAGDWLQYRNIGVFYIPSEGGRVDIHLESGAHEKTVGYILAGQIAILLLRKMGYPALHASAVLTDLGGVAFLGTHGRGKSTMAACFLRRGATLMTDDILPLRLRDAGVYGGPSLPIMKVWRDTATRALELPDELPCLIEGYEKKFLAVSECYPFMESPVPLRALYVLQRYDPVGSGRCDVVITPLGPRDSMAALMAQTSGSLLMTPKEMSDLLPFYRRLISQMPVRVLSYPHGYEHHESVYREVMQALEVE